MNYTFSDKMEALQPSAIREILKATADPNIISFAAGNPAPEAFPCEAVEKITAEIMGQNPIGALQYSISEGYPPLRDMMKEMCRSRYGVMGEDDDLIIVSGAQQGIDLVCKCLCNEGDTIIVENPSFVGALNTLRSYNANLVGVEMDQDGINIEKLEEALKANSNTKLMYLIPNFQNPSGITMSYEKRKAVYALAKKYGVIILEDNPYGELRFRGEDVPAIKTLDEDGLVVYCGSFSKVLSPGLRVGYLVANKNLMGKIVVAKQCTDVHTTILSQMICERFLAEYDFDQHIANLREIYRKKCGLMISEMDKHFSPNVTHTNPEGGLFLWCTLPQGSDMLGFCQKAVENGVAMVPGNAFMAQATDPTTSFRMNFSTPTDEKIIEGCEILGRLTKEMF